MSATAPDASSTSYDSPTFGKDGSFKVDRPVGSMSISPCGRDVVLASRQGLHIVDLDSPWSPPRHLAHHTPWEVADVQWSPFPSRDHWVVSTSNQKALVWNLEMSSRYNPVDLVIHGHTRALTDIQFSAHDPDMLATCAVDSFVHCWDLRQPKRPAFSFCDWFAGATQTKWNRRNSHIIASSHDRTLHIWDDRKGATPLRSLDAHDTKIYGIDWSRSDQNKIITCSLDKTIKFWDYSSDGSRPERLLRTPFPVWRARHTPFGYGIMAMPQRGDFDVHLYDCREENIWERDPDKSPILIEKFTGHEDNVKEFLWRPRGSSDEIADSREFQLVTWGSDHILRLHHLDDSLLSKTGFARGRPGYRTTRRGAVYKTFRVEDDELPPIPHQLAPLVAASNPITNGKAMMPGPSSGHLGWTDAGFLNTHRGTRTTAAQRQDLDPITWMKGVKIGKRDDKFKLDAGAAPPILNVDCWDEFDNLGEEVSHAGQTFSKVQFETIDINKRFIRMSLSGPWGKDRSQAFLTCQIEYPPDYPATAATVTLQEMSSIAAERVNEMINTSKTVTQAFAQQKKHSTEAIIHYLQGDRSLDDLIGLLKQGLETPDILPMATGGESSSEDEDELDPLSNAQLDELGLGASDVLASSNANANVPLPKACGAIWTQDGRLLCFFPPKTDKLGSATASYGLDGPLGSVKRKSRFFDGFGRFHSLAEARQSRTSSLGTIESSPQTSDSEDESSLTSSSKSSIAEGPLSDRSHSAAQQMMFTSILASSMSLKPIDIQGSQGSRKLDTSLFTAPKNIISIHDFRHLLPSNPALAGYQYDGLDIGHSNAKLTASLGLSELANAWHLVANLLVARGSMPVLQPSPTKSQAIRSISRHMSFNPDAHLYPFFAALSSSFLDSVGIAAAKGLFEHYVSKGDVQMAASLSCALRPILMPTPRGNLSNAYHNHFDFTLARSTPRLFLPRHNSTAIENSDEGSPTKHTQSSFEVSPRDDFIINPPSLASSLGAEMTDPRTSFSTSNASPNKRMPRPRPAPAQDQQQQSKSSSSKMWQFENASGFLARAGNIANEISKLSLSASASPPSRKVPSPTVSFNVSRPSRDSRSSFAGPELAESQHRPSVTDDFVEIVPPNAATEQTNEAKKKQKGLKVNYRREHHDAAYQNILSPAEQDYLNWLLRSYRCAYADLLMVWRLPVLRAEVLKHNEPFASTPSHTPAASMRHSGLTVMKTRNVAAAMTTTTEGQPLEFGRHSRAPSDEIAKKYARVRSRRLCVRCGVPDWPSEGKPVSAPFRCSACLARARPLACVLCNRMLRGKAFPCPTCGHVLHARCRFRASRDLSLEGLCPGGCDCLCAGRVVVDVRPAKKPDVPLAARSVRHRSSVDTIATEVRVDPLSFHTAATSSSQFSVPADAATTNAAAGTSSVAASSASTANSAMSDVEQQHQQQRQAAASRFRERHQSAQDGDGVDARSIGFAWARESLARNLELRRTRARSVDRRVDRGGGGGGGAGGAGGGSERAGANDRGGGGGGGGNDPTKPARRRLGMGNLGEWG